ncbi:MAG: hypothetical protein KY429_01535 [Actinobacteria bacterium]|nr:hypothetical protein [Actinomycetota bacterium]
MAPGIPVGVGIDANGKIVAGAGVSGVIGVVLPAKALGQDEQVNVLQDADLLETGFTPGAVYYAAAADGAISTDNTGTRVGTALEGGRFRVRVEHYG